MSDGDIAGPSENLDAEVWSAKHLRAASTAAGVALWSWDVDTDDLNMDERAYALWGVARDGVMTFEKLSLNVHPADRIRMRRVIKSTRIKPGPYEIDFRILRNGKVDWITARGLGADQGIVGRIMYGIFIQITERKLAEEAHEMLASEMSHRVKNLFAIVSSLTAIAASSAATTTEMARDLTQRLTALARAHDLIQQSNGDTGHQAALLGDLFAVFLAPYRKQGAVGDRITISVPEVHVGETAATTLALIVHELATNSAKYGSLSTADGTLNVCGTNDDGELIIIWTERGGPRVSTPTGPRGFGSKLILQNVGNQMNGSIVYDWQPSGVIATLRIDRTCLIA